MIDTHVHFWHLARGDYSWLTDARPKLFRDFLPTDFADVMAKAGVSGCIAVQAAPTEDETRYLLDLAEQHPWIIGVTGWADLTSAEIDRTLERLRRFPKLRAIRPMPGAARGIEWLATAEYTAGLAALAQSGLALEALALPHHLDSVAAVARAHPHLRIVINHAAKPAPQDLPGWSVAIQQFADLRNVFCKVSGFTQQSVEPDHHRKVFEHLIRVFEPARLMWGSDYPVLLGTSDYGEWRQITRDLLADLTAAEREQILHRTALGFYRRASDDS